MGISFHESASVCCPECDVNFDVSLWRIIDIAERPDLRDLLKAGTLDLFRCPHGHTLWIIDPLLIYCPEWNHVVFSAIPYDIRDAHVDAHRLLHQLRERLEPAADDPNFDNITMFTRMALGQFLGGSRRPQPAGPCGRSVNFSRTATDDRSHARAFLSDPVGTVKRQLAGIDATVNASEWIRLHINLASAYQMAQGGDKEQNLEEALQALTSVLPSVPQSSPEYHFVNMSLGDIYIRRRRGDVDSNIENAVKAYENVLHAWQRPEGPQPQFWAAAQLSYAAALLSCRRGDEDDHIARAIGALQAALDVTSANDPNRVKMLSALADAYSRTREGDRRENLERAIDALETAATVRTRSSDPMGWACLQERLAHALIYRSALSDPQSFDAINDMEQGISSYQHALSVPTWGVADARRLAVLWNLARLYQRRNLGTRADNLRLALNTFKTLVVEAQGQLAPDMLKNLTDEYDSVEREAQAIPPAPNTEAEIAPSEDKAFDLARADLSYPRNNVTCSSEPGRGDSVESLTEAVSALRRSFQSSSVNSAETRGAAQMALARAYVALGHALIVEEASNNANIYAAIGAYRCFRDAYQPGSDQELWYAARFAEIQAHIRLALRTDSTDLSHAIALCESPDIDASVRAGPARMRLSLARDYDRLATTCVTLGRRYGWVYAEMAIALLRRATDWATDSLVLWGQLVHNLGVCYLARRSGEHGDNVDRAIVYLEAALRTVKPEHDRELWASVQWNLGSALAQTKSGIPESNLRRAISSLETASTIYTRDAFPTQWATLHTNLGNAKHELGVLLAKSWHGPVGEGIDLFLAAIENYEQSLTVFTRMTHPFEWAHTQDNLGVLKSQTNLPHIGRREGIEHYEAALTCFTLATAPQEWAETHCKLAEAHLAVGDDTAALSAYSIVLNASSERIPVLSVARAAQGYLATVGDSGDFAESIRIAVRGIDLLMSELESTATDEGRSRLIAHSIEMYNRLVSLCLRCNRLTDALVAADNGRAQHVRLQFRGVQPAPAGVSEDLLREEEELLSRRQLLDMQIRTGSATARRRLLDDLDITQQRLQHVWNTLEADYDADDYVSTRRGDRLTWATLSGWLNRQPQDIGILEFWMASQESEIITFVARKGWSELQIHEVEAGPVLEAVNRLPREVFGVATARPTETWNRLASCLVERALPLLNGCDFVYVIPHPAIHALPIHAIVVDGEPVLTRFPVIYAPSISLAIRSNGAGRVLQATPPTAIVVGNPTLDLVHSQTEAEQVAHALKTRPLLGKDATKHAILSKLAESDIAHFAAHAFLDLRDGWLSGIRLANEEILNAREMSALPRTPRLLTLSACDTAVQHLASEDETVSMSRAFLAAGASSVVASLWKVDDQVSATLMELFYSGLLQSPQSGVARSLQMAALQVRQSQSATHRWAAFISIGSYQ